MARLGIQAKKKVPGNPVSSSSMRTFKGSLQEGNYHIGTFITTSNFSDPAKTSAESGHIRLIDGETLGRIMVDGEIGVIQKNRG